MYKGQVNFQPYSSSSFASIWIAKSIYTMIRKSVPQTQIIALAKSCLICMFDLKDISEMNKSTTVRYFG